MLIHGKYTGYNILNRRQQQKLAIKRTKRVVLRTGHIHSYLDGFMDGCTIFWVTRNNKKWQPIFYSRYNVVWIEYNGGGGTWFLNLLQKKKNEISKKGTHANRTSILFRLFLVHLMKKSYHEKMWQHYSGQSRAFLLYLCHYSFAAKQKQAQWQTVRLQASNIEMWIVKWMCKMDRKQLNNVCTLCETKAFKWIQIVHVFCHARPFFAALFHFGRSLIWIWIHTSFTSPKSEADAHCVRSASVCMCVTKPPATPSCFIWSVCFANLLTERHVSFAFASIAAVCLYFSHYSRVCYVQRIHVLLSLAMCIYMIH